MTTRLLTAEAYAAHQARVHQVIGARSAPSPSIPMPALLKPRTTNAADQLALVAATCRSLGIPAPVAEHRFHPDRKFRFDYAWPEQRLALEIEGGIWRKGGGAHSHPQNIERDIEKYSEAAVLGWRIVRAAPEDLLTKGLDFVRRAFAADFGSGR